MFVIAVSARARGNDGALSHGEKTPGRGVRGYTGVWGNRCGRPASASYRPKYFALRSVKAFHFSGRSSSAKIAETGHTGTQAPQSMHSTGSIKSWSTPSNCGASFLGWMQSTGQASTHAESFVPMQGSAITYAI